MKQTDLVKNLEALVDRETRISFSDKVENFGYNIKDCVCNHKGYFSMIAGGIATAGIGGWCLYNALSMSAPYGGNLIGATATIYAVIGTVLSIFGPASAITGGILLKDEVSNEPNSELRKKVDIKEFWDKNREDILETFEKNPNKEYVYRIVKEVIGHKESDNFFDIVDFVSKVSCFYEESDVLIFKKILENTKKYGTYEEITKELEDFRKNIGWLEK